MQYKIFEVNSKNSGIIIFYRNCNGESKQIAISNLSFSYLRQKIPLDKFQYGLLALVIFRDKFSKKIQNNRLDERIVNLLSEVDLTTAFLQSLADSNKDSLWDLVRKWKKNHTLLSVVYGFSLFFIIIF